jgi:hypothetical protein
MAQTSIPVIIDRVRRRMSRSALKSSDALWTSPNMLNPLPIERYITHYVDSVRQIVLKGNCCLLMGALGMGKTDVLKRVLKKIEEAGEARCVYINVGETDLQLAPRDLLRSVLIKLENEPLSETLSEHELRTRLLDWLKHNKRDLVMMLDQVELLDRDTDVLQLIRFLYSQAEGTSKSHDGAGRFIAVLASAESLRKRFAGETSPLYNVLEVVSMTDCPLKTRMNYWREHLDRLPNHDREFVIKQLDPLCGGDPHVIESITRLLHHQIAQLELSGVKRKGMRLQIDSQLAEIKDDTEKIEDIAPYLPRYLELVEDDIDAVKLLLKLYSKESCSVREQPAKEEGRTAAIWSGVFRQDGGTWKFRNELTRVYFEQEFLSRPERIARCLRRAQEYERAVKLLVASRANDAIDPLALLNSLQDVATDWIGDANSVNDAWQRVAQLTKAWFDGDAQVIRHRADVGGENGRALNHYRCVDPDSGDDKLSPKIAEATQRAFRERIIEAIRGEIVCRPYFDAGDLNQENRIWIFPLIKDRREYGALLWNRAAYDRETHQAQRKQDHIGRWLDFYNAVFKTVAQIEQRSQGENLLSKLLDLVQQKREMKDADALLRITLTTMTAGFGLKFNRAVLLQKVTGRHLRGKMGVGFLDQKETHEAWRKSILPTNFDDAKKLWIDAPTANQNLTPLDARTRKFGVIDWIHDPLLHDAIEQGVMKKFERNELVSSQLRALFAVQGACDGAKNDVFVLPLFDAGDSSDNNSLLGALIVDKPFTTERVTQDQQEQLALYANQLASVMGRERAQHLRRLFDTITSIGIEKHDLQETLDKISITLGDHLREMVSLIGITMWEKSDGSDLSYPDRRQSTLRVICDTESSKRLSDWRYMYYTGDEATYGPVDEALRIGEQLIEELPKWTKEKDIPAERIIDPTMRTVFSIALKSDPQYPPRGVISFQSRLHEAFSEDEIDLFRRIARRVTNVVEKAMINEGLNRARHHTARLNIALDALINPTDREELYRCIVDQMREFFRVDARIADSLALFETTGDELKCVAGESPECAIAVAKHCAQMRMVARSGEAVFVEHAESELVARERYGDVDCQSHFDQGAQASVWTRVGNELLFVMTWDKPRRLNQTERNALPVLAEIAARTNGVIEAERKAMREQLVNSLKIEDYELIEAEYAHRWSKRFRGIRTETQLALRKLDEAKTAEQRDAALAQLRERLRSIETASTESLNNLSLGGQVMRIERFSLKKFLTDIAAQWNLLNTFGKTQCEISLQLSESDVIETRQTILSWIINELLGNAKTAEERNLRNAKQILLSARAVDDGYQIDIMNNAKIPHDELRLMHSGSPLQRSNYSGRGVWIAAGQVNALLSGKLNLPTEDDPHTTFSIVLPKRIEV